MDSSFYSEAKNLRRYAISRFHEEMFCAARFTSDNLWYRAKIVKLYQDGTIITNHSFAFFLCGKITFFFQISHLNTIEGSALIHYIDYGNCEKLSLDRLRLLHEEFQKPTVLAVPISLANVNICLKTHLNTQLNNKNTNNTHWIDPGVSQERPQELDRCGHCLLSRPCAQQIGRDTRQEDHGEQHKRVAHLLLQSGHQTAQQDSKRMFQNVTLMNTLTLIDKQTNKGYQDVLDFLIESNLAQKKNSQLIIEQFLHQIDAHNAVYSFKNYSSLVTTQTDAVAAASSLTSLPLRVLNEENNHSPQQQQSPRTSATTKQHSSIATTNDAISSHTSNHRHHASAQAQAAPQQHNSESASIFGLIKTLATTNSNHHMTTTSSSNSNSNSNVAKKANNNNNNELPIQPVNNTVNNSISFDDSFVSYNKPTYGKSSSPPPSQAPRTQPQQARGGQLHYHTQVEICELPKKYLQLDKQSRFRFDVSVIKSPGEFYVIAENDDTSKYVELEARLNEHYAANELAFARAAADAHYEFVAVSCVCVARSPTSRLFYRVQIKSINEPTDDEAAGADNRG